MRENITMARTECEQRNYETQKNNLLKAQLW